MSKLRIAFYKAKHGGLDDKIINWGSGNDGYSHCEIMLDNRRMIGAHYKSDKVEIYNYNNVLSSDKWDVVEIDFDKETGVNKAKEFLNHDYDTLGVILYFLKIGIGDSLGGVWCSELCAEAINASTDLFILPMPLDTLIMPNELFRILMSSVDFKAKIVRIVEGEPKRFSDPQEDKYGRIKV